MKLKEYLIIIGLCILFFSAIYFRPEQYPVNGMDSYFFLNYIFGITNSIPETPVFSQIVMDIIPANLFVIKTIMLCITIISILLFCKASENIKPGYSVLVSLVLLGNIFFNKILIRFEDDILALPFIALSFYLITLYLSNGKHKYLYMALGSWVISCLFWKFAIYLIFLYALWTLSYIFIVPAIGSIVIFSKTLWHGFLGSFLIAENTPVIGILVLFLPLIIFLYSKKTNPIYTKIFLSLWLCLVAILANVKFALLFYPFLAIYWVVTLTKIPKAIQNINFIVIIVIFVMATYQNITAVPNNEYIELITQAKATQTKYLEKEINVSWGFGYIFMWNTKKPYPVFGHIQPTIEKDIIIRAKHEITRCPVVFSNKVGTVEVC